MANFNSTFTRDIPLSNLAADTSGITDTFIIDQVLPPITVDKSQGKIYRIDPSEDLRRQFDTKRAPGAVANRFSIDYSKPITFEAADHALATEIPIEVYAGADPIVARHIMQKTVPMTVHKLLLDREIKGVAALAAAVTSTGTPAIKWDAPGGVAITNIINQIVTLKSASGVRPDALALDSSVLLKLSQSAEYKDRIKHTEKQSGNVNDIAANLASACGLRKVIVSDISLKNAAKKGQTASLSDIWGANALLFKLVENPSEFYNGLGVHTIWNANDSAEGGGVVNGFAVDTKYDGDSKSWHYRASIYYDQVIVNPLTGYWFTNVLT
jgi:hypothetical protein